MQNLLEKLPAAIFLCFLGCCFASLLPLAFRRERGPLFDRTLVGMFAVGASCPFFSLGGLVIASALGVPNVARAFGVAAVVGVAVALLAVLTGATRATWNRVAGKRQHLDG